MAATAETVSVELHNVEQFATTLGVPVPSSWAPPLNDEGSQRWYLEMLKRHASAVGWALWYLIRREPPPRVVISMVFARFLGNVTGRACVSTQ